MANEIIVGEYEVSDLPGTRVDIYVTDTDGHMPFKRDDINGKGKFAITSDKPDYYSLCLTYTSLSSTDTQLAAREVAVEFKVGNEAKHLDPELEDKLSQLEVDLERIEDLTNSIIIDFASLKKRVREMRDTNDSTNRRLFYQTITSVLVVLALTFWQVLYLRQFFRTKKLID